MDSSKRRALLILNGLPNIGPISLNRLMEEFDNDPLEVLRASKSDLMRVYGVGKVMAETVSEWKSNFNLEREEAHLNREGMTFMTYLDDGYPGILREIHDPPIGLYKLGKYAISDPCVALVGTRRPTHYGRAVARGLATDLTRLGFCVVSGLARGVDTEAHRGALSNGGKTVAVMGCGLDIIYPPENLSLYREIGESGAVISEFPFGRRADRQTFPMRNRVIAGLCAAVVVVESDVHGGSMITARFAGEQGRQVFAVPGRIDQAASRGCNQLIRDGAVMLTSIDDLLDELRYLGIFKEGVGVEAGSSEVGSTLGKTLSDAEERILACFEGGEILHPESVTERSDLSPPRVHSSLMLLELKRLVAKRADGCYERIN